MTGVGGRPELIIIGSNSLEGPWEVRCYSVDTIPKICVVFTLFPSSVNSLFQEYNFLYKPGNINQPPPFVGKYNTQG